MQSFCRRFHAIKSHYKSKIMNYEYSKGSASSQSMLVTVEPKVSIVGKETAASFIQQPGSCSIGCPFPYLPKFFSSSALQLKFGTHRDFSTSCNGRALVPLFYKSTGQELFQSCVVRSTFPIRLLTTMGATEKPSVEDSSSVTPDTPLRIKFKRPDKTARHIMQILNKEAVEAVKAEREIPDIKPGYIVQLKVEVPENKRRVSIIKGIVIARRNAGLNTTFRLRRLVAGVGVESVFPLYSPNIKEFKVLDKKKVRRAKLYYLRDRMDAFKK